MKRLLPLAAAGLGQAAVAREEIDKYLENISGRVASGITGAVWQRRTLARPYTPGPSPAVRTGRQRGASGAY